MNRSIKVLTSIIAVFFLATITVFMINATDEKQTELTQQMLQKFPAQEGFSLREFKLPKEERVSSVDLRKFSDYTKDPKKYDNLIQKHQKSLSTTEKAFSVGHVAVNPDETFYDGVYFYPTNEHYLFLAFLSQKIKQGKTNEALKMLEQSNRFLVSTAGSPQTIISKLISISMLRTNAEFIKELLDNGAIKKTPSSLKESFTLTQTPEQMWDESTRKELQMISTIVRDPLTNDVIEAFGTPSFSEKIQKSILDWVYPKLFRRNHTLNMISAGYAALSSPACLQSDLKDCTYYEDITNFTVSNFYLNPAGRTLTKILLPKFNGVIKKFQISTEKLKETVATL